MFLGIDIGTSAVKVVLIDDKGAVMGSETSSLNVSRPNPKWSEQNPEDWSAGVARAIRRLSADQRRQVRAIGITGQMHGAVLLGQNHKVLRPAILWNDGRSEKEAEALQSTQPDFIDRGANLVMPGFTAPKIAWARQNEPAIFDQIETVLLPKDYVRLWLTGELATDPSDAAGTLWLDVERRKWHEPLLQACGLSKANMPKIYEGPEITGTLRKALAEEWGMEPVPVVAGGSDNAAGALGAGVLRNGETMLSLGTSGVIFTALNSFKKNPSSAVHAFCHALPDRWHLMSVMLSAASCLDWACKITNSKDVLSLLQAAEPIYKPASNLIFLPYLSGERTPHNDTDACGVLWGMSHDTHPGDIANAVLEGVAFGLADGFDALLSTGVDIEELSVIGGGSRSLHWGKILASALQRRLVYREGSDVGPALGAARLAQYSEFGNGEDDIFFAPNVQTHIDPDKELSALFLKKRARFQNLYKNLKDFQKES